MNIDIRDLHVAIEGKEILKGVTVVIRSGEVHAIMGPNGSGKSTLSHVLMGHPKYTVTKGDISVDGESVLALSPDERAKKGVFLSFQQPIEIPGVSFSKFLFTLAKQKNPKLSLIEFKRQLDANLALLGLDKSFVERDVNVGFSGGEKKRAELLQLLTLKPKFIILDELDSGLDIDSLKLLSKVITELRANDVSLLIITHYQRLLDYIAPDFVHVFTNGKIVESGDANLAREVEKKGYRHAVIR